MNTILITGDEGFIGINLAARLVDNNQEVIGFDLKHGDDIRNKYQLDQSFQYHHFDTVIHLAARAGVRTGQEFPEEFISTNIQGTLNLVELSQKYHVKHFVFFSSSSVYGSQPSPNKETDELKPVGVYGITKAVGEMLVQSSGIPYTIIRPFTVYGENGRLDQVIYKWINQIKQDKPITYYGDGETSRGYTYVGDLVDGVIEILKQKKEGIFNLGGNQIITLRQLEDLFRKVNPDLKIDPLALPAGDIFENYADINKAFDELGWQPITDFNEKVLSILKQELK